MVTRGPVPLSGPSSMVEGPSGPVCAMRLWRRSNRWCAWSRHRAARREERWARDPRAAWGGQGPGVCAIPGGRWRRAGSVLVSGGRAARAAAGSCARRCRAATTRGRSVSSGCSAARADATRAACAAPARLRKAAMRFRRQSMGSGWMGRGWPYPRPPEAVVGRLVGAETAVGGDGGETRGAVSAR